MKRKRLDVGCHPFDPYPFEALWWDSWKAVECLKIKNGVITMHILEDGKVVEEIIPLTNLRIKARKATMSDCVCLLRPGLDVCVLSDSDMEDSDKEKSSAPVWVDARIRSIERKPHESKCECQFYISPYQTQELGVTSKRLVNKEAVMMQIDRISILQKLESPCEDQMFRWSTSDDCSTRQHVRLHTGKFCSDMSWLLVASVLKRAVFDVRSIQNQIVYEISNFDSQKNQENSSSCSYALNFKIDNGALSPFIVQFVPGDTLAIAPSEELKTDGTLCVYNVPELRRSKRRNIKPRRFLACDLTEDDVDMSRLGGGFIYKMDYDDDMPHALSIQADHEYRVEDEEMDDPTFTYKKSWNESNLSRSGTNTRVRKEANESQLAMVPLSLASEGFAFNQEQDAAEDLSKTIDEMIANQGYSNVNRRKTFTKHLRPAGYAFPTRKYVGGLIYRGPGGVRRKYRPRDPSKKVKRGEGYGTRSEWESIYDMKPSASGRRKSMSAYACRELINRCMQNIDEAIRKNQPAIIDQWKEFMSEKSSSQSDCNKASTDNIKEEEETSEIDMLWKEMELALASLYFLDDNEEVDLSSTVNEIPRENSKKVCNHDYRLNEQIGIICRLCGVVSTEIKDVSPPLWTDPSYSSNKEQKPEEEVEQKPNKDDALNQFNIPESCSAPSEAEGKKNVWALIPELRTKLRAHQTKAFEFLWRNIAGSLVPARMGARSKRRGGCVISHTPGAGKTLLIIAFLVSYLKLFPGSRPLVLAPKTTLYTWYKEIIKWKIPIPVYQIHGGQTYKGEILRQRMKASPGLPRNQDVMHVVDCLEKMQKWLSHPSVLLMGYTSFLTLTREDSNYAHRKYMAQVLKQCPGILILDEGHNPRSTKSRLRKALMKVNTGLRILLSGTLFQNNFGEYFNTLLLARPKFVNEVLRKLDPKYKREAKSRFSLENRARKLFIDIISRNINSNDNEERMEGLNLLKSLTAKFIDNYEGGSAENLPGLQCYTLMMKSTARQQEILDKLQNQRPVYKGFPLELELLITLGAIHPWLIRTTACSTQYFTKDELENLSRTKFDVKFGSKVRFVMSLIPKCVFRKEKVLIFCHNIAPINMFLELFASLFKWRKGIEVMVLQGDIELFERGRVMDKFEEPGGPSKVMLASITACAEGISLTAASRVILLDSEWNPSKSKQAIARAFRPGQDKVVYVYQLLATGTLEEEKYSRTTWKEWVSSMIFSEELLEDPSHWQAPNLEDELLREIVEEDRGTLFHKIMKIDKAASVIRDKE